MQQQITRSHEFLEESMKTQLQRATQYDKQDGERSAEATAKAFNAITGKDLLPAEIYLIQQILKDVRQWSNLSAPHIDSLLDCVSYSSLKAEQLCVDLNHEKTPISRT